MNAPPDDVKLSREEGESLIERLQANTLTSDDRRLLVKLIQLYFWLTVALQETKISLKRLKRALFGGKPPPPSAGGGSPSDAPTDSGGGAPPSAAAPGEPSAPDGPVRRHGHGRQGAVA